LDLGFGIWEKQREKCIVVKAYKGYGKTKKASGVRHGALSIGLKK